MLERYINWLADGHAVSDRNSYVDINLRELNGGLTFLNYSVSSGSHGMVFVQADGYTALFTPSTNYSGMAGFSYSATLSSTEFKVGPIPVGVLVSSD